MDLPVWQALYTELAPRNFVVITVAMDAGGAADAGPWIEQAAPTHPSVIDVQHRVAELYDWVNVPSIAWIDEAGSHRATQRSRIRRRVFPRHDGCRTSTSRK